MSITIKLLHMTDGDGKNIQYNGNRYMLEEEIKQGRVIEITHKNKKLYLNTRYIIGYELEE